MICGTSIGGEAGPLPPWLRLCPYLKHLLLLAGLTSTLLGLIIFVCGFFWQHSTLLWKQRWSPWGQILKSLALASRPQVLENWPVLGSRTVLFFEVLKFCGALEKTFGKRFFVEIAWKIFVKTFFFFLESSCACVLGLGLGFFLCPWPRALCPRLHLCLEGLKPAELRSQFNLQFKSAHTVSFCKLVLFLVTIFRTTKKVFLLDAFEWGMHRGNFINAARLLKMHSLAIFFRPIKPQNLSTCRSLRISALPCNWYSKNSSSQVEGVIGTTSQLSCIEFMS